MISPHPSNTLSNCSLTHHCQSLCVKCFSPSHVWKSARYLLIVVAQGPAQFVIVHVGLVLASAPKLGHLFGLQQLELALLVGPADELLLTPVQEKLQQELPQSDRAVHGIQLYTHTHTHTHTHTLPSPPAQRKSEVTSRAEAGDWERQLV